MAIAKSRGTDITQRGVPLAKVRGPERCEGFEPATSSWQSSRAAQVTMNNKNGAYLLDACHIQKLSKAKDGWVRGGFGYNFSKASPASPLG